MKKLIWVFYTLLVLFSVKTYSEVVSPYPLVNSNIEKFNNVKKDDSEIPLLNYNGKDIYYPIQISQIALGYYSNYTETKNENSKIYFLKLANWLKNNFTDNGSWGGVYCEDPLKGSGYNLPDRWISAMSQGFTLSVFVEAYNLTKDNDYLLLAEKILNSFDIKVVDGGIASDWGTSVWFDEYPSMNHEKHVLNGFLFSLAGLYDFYAKTGNVKAFELFNNGVESLKEHLSAFNSGYNSFYSQSTLPSIHGPASATGNKYHDLHVAQLLWVYSITDDNFFKNWAHLFLKQDFGDIQEYGIKSKIKTIVASNTIEPVNYGANRLYDSIWTYGEYWSTNKFPTELYIEFNRNVTDISDFVLVTTQQNLNAADIELGLIDVKDKTTFVKFKLIEQYQYQTRHHIANVHLFKLENVSNQPKEIKAVKLIFKSNSEKVLALRQVNFYYDMSDEISFLLNKI